MLEDNNTQKVTARSKGKDMGKALREKAPRSSHGDWQPAADRPNPLQPTPLNPVGTEHRQVDDYRKPILPDCDRISDLTLLLPTHHSNLWNTVQLLSVE